MKITVIHGQSHKGSTYHLAHSLAEKLGGEITEFFLPRDFGEFCVGCTSCFMTSETKCPHYERLAPITNAIDNADVLILESPVYVMHATGAMKALLDHYGYRFMVHRPEEKMFTKQAVCISTAAGAAWERVKDKKKQAYDKKLSALAEKIKKRQGKVKPSLKTKVIFNVMGIMQKNGFNKADADYWKEKGWTEKKRPWKV